MHLKGLIASLVSRKTEEVGPEDGESRVWGKKVRAKGAWWGIEGKVKGVKSGAD